ncbi:NAD-binding protein [Halorhabdus salina]|uniref:NAD-binding protein n=1 Tax=Halorhabdus salina TaxID=2750670 RepID=UPI0015EE5E66|nr:NAD-binding protein [Halorhabdus salina]
MSQTGIDRVDVLVVGSTSDVRGLAEHLQDSQSVLFLTDRNEQEQRAERAGVSAQLTTFETGFDSEELTADVAFLGTQRDSINLLLAQHLRTSHGVDRVIVRVNDSTREKAFDDIATDTVTPIDLYTRTVQETLETA